MIRLKPLQTNVNSSFDILTKRRNNTIDLTFDNSKHYDKSYLIIIACDDYINKNFTNLDSTISDAEKISEVFQKHNFTVFAKLYNRHATKNNILNVFDRLSNETSSLNNKKIRLICYIACHGFKSQIITPDNKIVNKSYFALYNTDEKFPISTALEMNTFSNLCKQLNIIHQCYLIDSCYAGDIFISNTRSPLNVYNYTNTILNIPCCICLCSSASNQKTIETKQHGSIFAKTICKIFDNKNIFNNKKYVLFSSLIDNIRQETYTICENYNQQQTVIFGNLAYHGDFIFFKDDFNKKLKKRKCRSNSI